MNNISSFDQALELILAEHMPIHPDHQKDVKAIKSEVRYFILDYVIGKNDSVANPEFHGRKYDVKVRNDLRTTNGKSLANSYGPQGGNPRTTKDPSGSVGVPATL